MDGNKIKRASAMLLAWTMFLQMVGLPNFAVAEDEAFGQEQSATMQDEPEAEAPVLQEPAQSEPAVEPEVSAEPEKPAEPEREADGGDDDRAEEPTDGLWQPEVSDDGLKDGAGEEDLTDPSEDETPENREEETEKNGDEEDKEVEEADGTEGNGASEDVSEPVTAADVATATDPVYVSELRTYSADVPNATDSTGTQWSFAFEIRGDLQSWVDSGNVRYSVSAEGNTSLSVSFGGNGSTVSGKVPTGTRQIVVTADAEDTQNPSVSCAVTLSDAEKPSITHVDTDGYAGGWTNQTVTLTPTAADDVAVRTVYFRKDAEEAHTYTEPIVVSADGDQTYSFWAVDVGGNESEVQTVRVMLDQAAPTASAQTIGDYTAWRNVNSIVLGGLGEGDGYSPWVYRTAESENGPWADVGEAGAFAEQTVYTVERATESGEYAAYFRVCDTAGNVQQQSPTAVTLRYDATAPELIRADSTQEKGYTRLTIEAADAHAGVASIMVKAGELGADAFAQGETNLTDGVFDVTADGYYTVGVRDHAGNVTVQNLGFISVKPGMQNVPTRVDMDEDVEKTLIYPLVGNFEGSDSSVSASVDKPELFASVAGEIIASEDGYSAQFVLVPAENVFAEEKITLTLTVVGANGEDSVYTVDLYLNAVNDAPIAVDDAAETRESTAVSVSVLENDIDIDTPNADWRIASIGTQPENGRAEIAGEAIVYTPDLKWYGEDVFTYYISDGLRTSAEPAKVHVLVCKANDTPKAKSAEKGIDEDQPFDMDLALLVSDADLLGEDALVWGSESDAAGYEKLTLTVSEMPQNGTAVIGEDGRTLTYTPNKDYYGDDVLTYCVTDAEGRTAEAQITITIEPINDAPELRTVNGENVVPGVPLTPIVIDEDETDAAKCTFMLTVYDAETEDPSDLMVRVTSSDRTKIRNSSIVLTNEGETYTVVFAPEKDANGECMLNIEVSDGAISASRPLKIIITPINDDPVANDDDMSAEWHIPEGMERTLDLKRLLANDTDVDKDMLTVVDLYDELTDTHFVVNEAAQTARVTAPSIDAMAKEWALTYTVSDGNGGTETAQVTLMVIKVDKAPQIVLPTAEMGVEPNPTACDEDAGAQTFVFYVSDADTPAKDLKFSIISDNPSVMAFNDNPNVQIKREIFGEEGQEMLKVTVTVAPYENQYGTMHITATVSDGYNKNAVTFPFEVISVPDAPNAVDDEYTIAKGRQMYFMPIENDTDVEHDRLEIVDYTSPEEGELIQAAGDSSGFTYQAPLTLGDYTFTYTISDGTTADNATATVTLHVVDAQDGFLTITPQSASMAALTNSGKDMPVAIFGNNGADDIDSVSVTVQDGNMASASIGKSGEAEGEYNYTLHVDTAKITGTTKLTIKAVSTTGKVSVANVFLNIRFKNNPPIANETLLEGKEGTAFSVKLSDLNVSDADGDPLRITSIRYVSGLAGYVVPSQGGFRVTPSGSTDNGEMVLEYTVTDGIDTITGRVVIDFKPADTKPHAWDDWYTVKNETGAQREIVPGTLMGNDSDYDGTGKYFGGIIEQPKHGTLTWDETKNTYIYTRTELGDGEHGTDSFTYWFANTKEDAEKPFDPSNVHQSNAATVHIYEQYPHFTLHYGEMNTKEDTPNPISFSINVENGLTEPYSYDFEIVSITPQNGHGSFTLGGNAIVFAEENAGSGTSVDKGSVVLLYTPEENFYGRDDYTVTIRNREDGKTLSTSLLIYVEPVNDAPTLSVEAVSEEGVAVEENTVTINEDGTVTFTAQFGDVDNSLDELDFSAFVIVDSEGESVVADKDSITVERNDENGTATITFKPIHDESGELDIRFAVSDGAIQTAQTIHVIVLAVDDPPVTPDYDLELDEDAYVTNDVMAWVSDVDTEKTDLTVVVSVKPQHGTAIIEREGEIARLTYRPFLNFNGEDVLTYKVYTTEEESVFSEGTISLTVNPVNDAPVLYGLPYKISVLEDLEDQPEDDKAIKLTFRASDVEDGQNLLFAYTSSNERLIASHAEQFELTQNADGTFTILLYPEKDMHGDTVISLTVTDRDETAPLSVTRRIPIHVASVNDAPKLTADPLSMSTTENTVLKQDHELVIDVLQNVTDVEDDQDPNKHVQILDFGVSDQGLGTVRLENNKLVYTPLLNQNGRETLNYTVVDSDGGITTGTIVIDIVAVNTPPETKNDTAVIDEYATMTVDVRTNDTDVEIARGEDPGPLHVTGVTVPQNAAKYLTAEVVDDQIKLTAHRIDMSVMENIRLTYTVTDNHQPQAGAGTGYLYVTINNVPEAPEVKNGGKDGTEQREDFVWAMDEDGTETFYLLLSTDVYPSVKQLLVTNELIDAEGLIRPVDIRVTGYGNEGKAVTIHPLKDQYGSFSIHFMVSDRERTSEITIPVTVHPINDEPVVSDVKEFYETAEDTPITQNITVTDVETPRKELAFAIASDAHQPQHGMVSVVASGVNGGQWTYTPNPNYNGWDSFTISVTDKGAVNADDATNITVSVTINLNVTAVNDLPQAVDDAYRFDEAQGTAPEYVLDVLANDTDADIVYGDALRIMSVGEPPALYGGQVRVSNNKLYYTPTLGNNRDVSFDYIIADQAGGMSMATVRITFTPVDNEPGVGADGEMPMGRDDFTRTEDCGQQRFVNVAMQYLDDVDADPVLNKEPHRLRVVSVDFADGYKSDTAGTSIHGSTISVDNERDLLYTPAANYHGKEFAVYVVEDMDDSPVPTRANIEVELRVNPAPDAPTIAAIQDAAESEAQVKGDVVIERDIAVDDADMEFTRVDGTVITLSETEKLTVTAVSSNKQLIRDDSIAILNAEGTDADVTGRNRERKIVLTPEAFANGESIITVTVTDTTGSKASTDFKVEINAVDSFPNLVADTAEVDEGSFVIIDVLRNDDPDLKWEGDKNLHIKSAELGETGLMSVPELGELEIVPNYPCRDTFFDGETGLEKTREVTRDVLKFTPNADWTSKTDVVRKLSYDVKDAHENGGTTVGTNAVSVTVHPVNDAPTINGADTMTIWENNMPPEEVEEDGNDIYFTVGDEEDFFGERDALTVTVESVTNDPDNFIAGLLVKENVTVTHETEGDHKGQWKLHIDPTENLSGQATVVLRVTDTPNDVADQTDAKHAAKYAEITVAVTVNSVDNNFSENGDDAAVTPEDTPTTIDVIVNDAIDLTTQKETELTIVNLHTDKDLCGQGQNAAQTENGAAIGIVDNQIRYAPAKDWNSHLTSETVYDTFYYRVAMTTENRGAVYAVFKVSLEVTPVNDAPVIDRSAWKAERTVEETVPATFEVRVTDVDHAPSEITLSASSSNTLIVRNDAESIAITHTNPDNETVGEAAVFSVTIQPNGKFNGKTELTFTATDGADATDTEKTMFVVGAVNDPPEPVQDETSIPEGTKSYAMAVLANDKDPDIETNVKGEELFVKSGSVRITAINGQQTDLDRVGTLTVSADRKSVVFTLRSGMEDWNGEITYTYTAEDNGGGTLHVLSTECAGNTLTITQVNDAPNAADLTGFEVNEDLYPDDAPLAVDLASVIEACTDIDMDESLNADPSAEVLSMVLEEGTYAALHGEVAYDEETNRFLYTPDADYNGSDTITYTIQDKAGARDTGTLGITVHPTNDQPRPKADTQETIGDKAVTAEGTKTFVIPVLENDTDTDLETNPNAEELFVKAGSVRIETIGRQRTDFESVGTFSVSSDRKSVVFTLKKGMENWNGVIPYTYTVEDNGGGEVPKRVLEKEQRGNTLTITQVNDAPTAAKREGFEVNEDLYEQDGPLQIPNVIGSCTDIDQDEALNADPSAEVLSMAEGSYTAEHGTVTYDAESDTLLYTPDPNYNGPDTITYTVQDVAGETDSGTIQLTVKQANDAPIAPKRTAETDEDTKCTIWDILKETFDVDRDPSLNADPKAERLTVAEEKCSATHGTVKYDAERDRFVFTPDTDFNGEAVITYVVADKAGAESTSTITVTVHPVNDKPEPAPDTETIKEGESTTIDVLANDTDADVQTNGDKLSVVSVEATDHKEIGLWTVGEAGKNIVFTLNPEYADWNGTITFRYTVTDIGGGAGAEKALTATQEKCTLVIEQVNDAPVAPERTAETDEDDEVKIPNILKETFDVDRDPKLNADPKAEKLTVVEEKCSATHGTVRYDAERDQFIFTPEADFNGEAIITYVVADKAGAESMATITVTVRPVNDKPETETFVVEAWEDEELVMPAEAILAHCSDADRDETLNAQPDTEPLTVEAFEAEIGTAVFDAETQTLTYTPKENFNGTDTLTYIVKDASGASAKGTFAMDVRPVNDPPVAVKDSGSMRQDDELVLDITLNDTDIDRDPKLNRHTDADTVQKLTVATINGEVLTKNGIRVQNGMVYPQDTGIRFIPDTGWFGVETFKYQASDSEGALSDEAEVTIEVEKKPATAPLTGNQVYERCINPNDRFSDSFLVFDREYTPEPYTFMFYRLNKDLAVSAKATIGHYVHVEAMPDVLHGANGFIRTLRNEAGEPTYTQRSLILSGKQLGALEKFVSAPVQMLMFTNGLASATVELAQVHNDDVLRMLQWMDTAKEDAFTLDEFGCMEGFDPEAIELDQRAASRYNGARIEICITPAERETAETRLDYGALTEAEKAIADELNAVLPMYRVRMFAWYNGRKAEVTDLVDSLSVQLNVDALYKQLRKELPNAYKLTDRKAEALVRAMMPEQYQLSMIGADGLTELPAQIRRRITEHADNLHVMDHDLKEKVFVDILETQSAKQPYKSKKYWESCMGDPQHTWRTDTAADGMRLYTVTVKETE